MIQGANYTEARPRSRSTVAGGGIEEGPPRPCSSVTAGGRSSSHLADAPDLAAAATIPIAVVAHE
jgi:hypothetical protein